jgi:hypothetical protein
MKLIIAATLSEPPSESLPFRHVTLESHVQLQMDCLVEVERQMKDAYYRYLLNRGLLDWVEELVTPEERESGLRIASEKRKPMTIQVQSITFDNYIEIIDRIRNYHGLVACRGNAPLSVG